MSLPNQENKPFFKSLDTEDVEKTGENVTVTLMNIGHRAEPLESTFSIPSVSALHDPVSEKALRASLQKNT